MFWSKFALSLVLVTSIVASVFLISVNAHPGVWTAIKSVTNQRSSNTTSISRAIRSPQGKKEQRREVEAVTITPDGFEPQQLERTAGPFVLSVINQSGMDALNIRIETELHGRFREKSLPLITPYWRELIDPPPGRYVITEESHPDWTLTLIIK